ncbi:MAG TPA: FecR domain-containing protein [Chitinophagaceae bacterium]
MDKNRLFYLIDQVNKGRATPEELAEYDAYLNGLTVASQEWDSEALGMEDLTREELRDILNRQILSQPVRRIRLWPRIAAAASILLIFSAGGYFLLHQKQAVPAQPSTAQSDIAPGGNKAILTLAGGQKIVLSSLKNGQVARQGHILITKTAAGQLSYRAENGEAIDPQILYNTITTPVTGQHEITLADGTEVMLDALSSITFPVAFNGKTRKVSITGQAWFKVKHNAGRPFEVEAKGQVIRDIGTEFNVNAYADEPTIKTTLIEGSVAVNNKLIKPGEQATGTGGAITIKQVDIEPVIAWRKGSFLFRNQDLKVTLRQLARWYDLEIVYDDLPENLRLGGYLPRSTNLSVVLNAIEQTGEIKFRLDGHRLHVYH